MKNSGYALVEAPSDWQMSGGSSPRCRQQIALLALGRCARADWPAAMSAQSMCWSGTRIGRPACLIRTRATTRDQKEG